MRESRVTFIAGLPLTVSADGTTTGESIDLKSGYVGDYFEGSPAGYGLGGEILLTSITGTAFTVEAYWETSSDNSTWVRDELIYPATDVVAASAGGTKLVIPFRLRTPRRYARMKIVSASMSGESFVITGVWLSDGSGDLNGVPTRI